MKDPKGRRKLQPGQRIRLICPKCKSPAYMDEIRYDSDDPKKVYATIKCTENLCGHSVTVEGWLP